MAFNIFGDGPVRSALGAVLLVCTAVPVLVANTPRQDGPPPLTSRAAAFASPPDECQTRFPKGQGLMEMPLTALYVMIGEPGYHGADPAEVDLVGRYNAVQMVMLHNLNADIPEEPTPEQRVDPSVRSAITAAEAHVQATSRLYHLPRGMHMAGAQKNGMCILLHAKVAMYKAMAANDRTSALAQWGRPPER